MLRMVLVIDGENFMGQAWSVRQWPDFLGLREFLLSRRAGAFLLKVIAYLPLPPKGHARREDAEKLHEFLRARGFEVEVKEGVAREDGSFEANLDTDVAAGVMELALTRRPDLVLLVSGDGDFASLCRRLLRWGIHTEVASLPRRLSGRLRKAACSVINLEPFFKAA